MYDLILTKGEFDGTPKLKKRYRRIYTKKGDLAGALTDKRIYDLNGEVIAKSVDKEKRENDLGEKEVVITYRAETDADRSAEGAKKSENSGENSPEKIENAPPAASSSQGSGQGENYTLAGNKVYREAEYIGLAESKKKTRVIVIPLIFLLGLLALLIGLRALIEPITPTPEPIIPVITVRDDDGYWGEGTINVFDGLELLYPEQEGDYTFIIENPHDVALRYSFEIQAGYEGRILSGEELAEFPLLFRLKMNNAYVMNEEETEPLEWLTAEELKYDGWKILEETAQEFTLEYMWPFESGNDIRDTDYGKKAGEVYLTLTLTAEEW